MKNKIKKVTAYGYILPITVILMLFVVGSVILSLILGFTKYNIITPPVFRGLDNYVRLMGDPKFIKALQNTVKLMIIIVPLQTILGLIVSVFLTANKKKFLGKLANTAIFVPVLCSSAVVGVVWRELLNGKIPIIERLFGLFSADPSMILGSAKSALIAVGLISVWKSLGYYCVIYTSGLLEVPTSCYEAAKVDGAGAFRQFFSITLPLLKPTVIMVLFLSTTGALQSFDLIFNLTGGGPNNATTTLVLYIYSLCFGSGAAGYAMSISNVLFFIILAIALLQKGLLKRETSEIGGV